MTTPMCPRPPRADAAATADLLRQMIREMVEDVLAEREREGAAPAAGSADLGDELLSQTDAAALIGVSVSTIRAWQRSGELGRYGKGKAVRVKRSELLARRDAPPTQAAKAPVMSVEAQALAIMKGGGRRHG